MAGLWDALHHRENHAQSSTSLCKAAAVCWAPWVSFLKSKRIGHPCIALSRQAKIAERKLKGATEKKTHLQHQLCPQDKYMHLPLCFLCSFEIIFVYICNFHRMWTEFSPETQRFFPNILKGINNNSSSELMNNRIWQHEKDKLYSRVLVGLISSNVWAVDFLAKYSYDADEQDKVHLWRIWGQ